MTPGLFGDPFGNYEPDRDRRRKFTRTMEKEVWANQDGKCATSKQNLDPRSTQYDHIKPWAEGGATNVRNGQPLCANCHSKKTHKSRLKKTRKIQSDGKGAYKISIPKRLVENRDLKAGDELEWKLRRDGKWVLAL